jgi:hypothetical protein
MYGMSGAVRAHSISNLQKSGNNISSNLFHTTKESTNVFGALPLKNIDIERLTRPSSHAYYEEKNNETINKNFHK